MPSYNFDGSRDNNLKSFNTVHELTIIFDISLKRVVLSVLMICYKNGERYTVRYKIVDGVFLLFMLNPNKPLLKWS